MFDIHLLYKSCRLQVYNTEEEHRQSHVNCSKAGSQLMNPAQLRADWETDHTDTRNTVASYQMFANWISIILMLFCLLMARINSICLPLDTMHTLCINCWKNGSRQRSFKIQLKHFIYLWNIFVSSCGFCDNYVIQGYMDFYLVHLIASHNFDLNSIARWNWLHLANILNYVYEHFKMCFVMIW